MHPVFVDDDTSREDFIKSCEAGDITGETHNKFSAEVIMENKPCIMLLEKLGFKKTSWGMNMSSEYGFYRYEYAAQIDFRNN